MFKKHHVPTPVDRGTCNILLGCTASVACVKVPSLLTILAEVNVLGFKADIKMIITKHALHFIDLQSIRQKVTVYTDEDEWSSWNKMSDPVLHIELRKWADVLVIAPLGANSMAKIANGICDNLLTCVARAWDRDKPLIFCPAMNTHMWEHPLTSMHTTQLQDLGYEEVPCVKKKLACGEVGFGAMAEVETIVGHVTQALLNMKEKII